MGGNVLKRDWFELATELKERWPDFTQADLHYIAGDEGRLIEVVERRRHITRVEAERDVRFFIATLPPRQRLA